MTCPPVVTLPYVAPPRSLTARHGAQNLKEHLEGFLAANNKDGSWVREEFVGDTPAEPDRRTVAGRLQWIANQSLVSLTELDTNARLLKLSSGKIIAYEDAMDIVGACLGYDSIMEVVRVSRGGSRLVKNRALFGHSQAPGHAYKKAKLRHQK